MSLSLHAHMGSFSRDRGHIGKKQMDILKIQSVVIEVKNVVQGLLRGVDVRGKNSKYKEKV